MGPWIKLDVLFQIVIKGLTVVVVVFCCFVDSLALKSPYGERSIKYVCM